MTGVTLDLKVDDIDALRVIEELRHRFNDLSPLLHNIGAHMVLSTQDRWDEGVAPDGTEWESTEDNPRKKNPRTLVETGRLRDSIAYRTDVSTVQIGTNVVYAAIHQFGGTTSPHTIRPQRKKALAWPGGNHPVKKVNHPGSRIPARPYLGVSDDDQREILQIIHDYISLSGS